MLVFKNFFQIMWAKRVLILIYFIVFLGLTAILSTVAHDDMKSQGFEASKLDIALIDKDHSEYSDALMDYFGKQHNLTKIKDDRADILDQLYWRELDYVIVIPKGFSVSLTSDTKEMMKLESMSVPGYFDAEFFESELKLYNNKLTQLLQSDLSMSEATDEMMELRDETAKVEMASFVNQNQNDRVMGFFLYVPYLFVSLGIIAIADTLLTWNKKDLRDRIDCSSTKLSQRNIGLLAGILCFGAILFIVVLVYGSLITKGTLLTDKGLPYFCLNALCFLFFSLSVGFFVGNIAGTSAAVNGIVNVFSLALCFLGGIFVPQEFFGEGIKKVAQFMPSFWYVRNNDMIGSVSSFDEVFLQKFTMQSGVILLYGVAFILITLVVLNIKRTSKA